MITLDNNTYIHSIWHVAWSDGNFLGTIYKECPIPLSLEGSSGWIFKCRFRHYVDNKIFNSDDEKHWYETRPEGDDSEVLIGLLEAVEHIKEGAKEILKEETISLFLEEFGSDEKVIEAIKESDIFHTKVEERSKEE